MKKRWGVLLGLGAVLAGLWWYAAGCQWHLEIRLTGSEEMTIEYGEPFSDPGATAMVYGDRFCKQGILPRQLEIQASDTVNLEKTGKYGITYIARCFGMEQSVRRIVRVVDTRCPEIYLTEDDPEQTGLPYRAVDNYDGDITDRVIRTEENGIITYAVVDSSGNPAYVQREIPGVDTKAPRLLLEGETEMAIPVGTFYQEPGYSAVDAVDGDVTELVSVSGEVDWLHPGTYALTYTVSDSADNMTTATRTVTVTAQERPETIWPEEKVIYLTFDDGPGPDTLRLLDILDEYGVKATFFVTDSGYPAAMKEIVDRGHSIGIHTASHKYSQVYADAESYFQDLHRIREVIRDATGVETTLLRFPGGSSNTISQKTCPGLMTQLVEAVQDAGFQYFDWNVDSDDAGHARRKDMVYQNVTLGIAACQVAVVLQHDVHRYSVDAVEDIIVWGLNNGYTFRALDENSPGMHHSVYN